MSTSIATPWGHPDTVKEIAPGIIRYDTPSHGGYYVSPERVLTMPKPLREFKPFAGPNWYEEDCDWAIVALAFPQFFPDDQGSAYATLKAWKPELYDQLMAMRTEGRSA